MANYGTSTASNYCNLCGSQEGMMTTLRDEYATENVKCVCGSCHAMINDHLSKLQNLSFKWWHLMIRKFIKSKEGK